MQLTIRTLFWGVIGTMSCWAAGALYFDLHPAAAAAYVLTFLAVIIFLRRRAMLAATAMFAGVLAWWLMLQPDSDRSWQPDVAETAWAEIDGDDVTIHNVRNCDYITETNYTPRWATRRVRLSQLTGVDIAINYWGSPWMAHPIFGFQFADAPPICFSIETRKEIGESYSAIGGLYRQYELTYVVAEESDVIRVRTNFRKGEDVYRYRMTLAPEKVRERFLDYLHSLNELRDRPRWYNAITTNCTTSIRAQHSPGGRIPWDWRILLNGKADEMLFERGLIKTGGLSFAELKKRALLNPPASDQKRR